ISAPRSNPCGTRRTLSASAARLKVGERWETNSIARAPERLYTRQASFGSGAAPAFPARCEPTARLSVEEHCMKRLALALAVTAGLALSASACTPVTGGVGTACQGDAHRIVCR